MNDPRRPMPGLRATLERLAPSLDAAPDTAWRERLRDQFVHDAIPAIRSPIRRLALVPAAIAALAVAAAFVVFVSLPSGPGWQLISRTGEGSLRIDGRDLQASDSLGIAAALRSGADIELPPEAQLDLVLPGVVVMQIPGGTHATLPTRPGRWLHRGMNASLTQGEVRFATGPGFHGARLTVTTPLIRAVVTGTTLAVLCDRDTTCVCVFDGRVGIESGTSRDSVLAGTRRSMFQAGLPARIEPIRDMELMKLSMLRDRAGAILGR